MELFLVIMKIGWILGGLIGLGGLVFLLWIVFVGLCSYNKAGDRNSAEWVSARVNAEQALEKINLIEDYFDIVVERPSPRYMKRPTKQRE